MGVPTTWVETLRLLVLDRTLLPLPPMEALTKASGQLLCTVLGRAG